MKRNIPSVLWLFCLLSMYVQARTIRTDHGTWKLVWQDEFKGHKLSGERWRKIPRQRIEWSKYMSDADACYRVTGGKLTLRGIVNDVLPGDTACYLTGGVTTSGLKLFGEGRIEIRLKMDNAIGAWPAAWLLPQFDPWPEGGEVDIMERLNGDNFAYQTVHSWFTERDKAVKNKPRSGFKGSINVGKYNTYGVELYKDSLCFFINDKYTGTYRRQEEYGKAQYPFDRPMYLLIDMQLGGSWVGTVDPKQLPYEYKIDYVRFYKKK